MHNSTEKIFVRSAGGEVTWKEDLQETEDATQAEARTLKEDLQWKGDLRETEDPT